MCAQCRYTWLPKFIPSGQKDGDTRGRYRLTKIILGRVAFDNGDNEDDGGGDGDCDGGNDDDDDDDDDGGGGGGGADDDEEEEEG